MANKTGLTSDRRLYLDKDGNVVEQDDPNKASLLVAQGGILSDEDAAKYGISAGEDGALAYGEDVEDEAEDAGEGEESPKTAKKPAAKKKASARKK